MMVRVDHSEQRTLRESSLRVSGDIEKTELDCLRIRRHLSLPARPVSGVTIMDREQTIPIQVDDSDLMVCHSRSSRLMQNRRTTGCEANCDVDRLAHNRTLPRTSQGFHFLERLLRVRWRGGVSRVWHRLSNRRPASHQHQQTNQKNYRSRPEQVEALCDTAVNMIMRAATLHVVFSKFHCCLHCFPFG